MTNYSHTILSEQKGSALVITVLVILALTAIGLTAIRVSTLDNKIAANYKFHKMTYYATNGACQMTSELVERAVNSGSLTEGEIELGDVEINNWDFDSNTQDCDDCENNNPSETNHDILVPNLGQADVYIKVYSEKGPNTDNGAEQFSGDRGAGKTMAKGGMRGDFSIRGFGRGLSNSQSRAHIRWRHVN